MMCALPSIGSKEDAEAFSRMMYDVTMHEADAEAPLYLRIQSWHAAQLSEWVEGGKKEEDYKFQKNHFMTRL